MEQELAISHELIGNTGRKRGFSDKIEFNNIFQVEHWRDGKKIATYKLKNDITNEGKNLLLDVMFNTASQIANNSWFIGLIGITGFSALAASDVMNSHAGWTEFTGYSQSNRVAWGSGAASGQSVTNGTAAQFDITASSDTLKGVFIPTNSTKSGTTGKLWATALFTNDVPVVSGDQLKVTYTVNT